LKKLKQPSRKMMNGGGAPHQNGGAGRIFHSSSASGGKKRKRPSSLNGPSPGTERFPKRAKPPCSRPTPPAPLSPRSTFRPPAWHPKTPPPRPERNSALSVAQGVKKNPPYTCRFQVDADLKALPEPIPEDLVYNKDFMEAALAEAWKAFDQKEVPVGAVFVRGGRIIARVHNLTNEERNATRHCEIIGVDIIIRDFKAKHPEIKDLSGFVIYVTCEPCIMCASALRLVHIAKVFFGCRNEKFGGLGSVLQFHVPQGPAQPDGDYSFGVHGGILEDRCVDVLRTFYERGNPKLPPEKRHRRSKKRGKGGNALALSSIRPGKRGSF